VAFILGLSVAEPARSAKLGFGWSMTDLDGLRRKYSLGAILMTIQRDFYVFGWLVAAVVLWVVADKRATARREGWFRCVTRPAHAPDGRQAAVQENGPADGRAEGGGKATDQAQALIEQTKALLSEQNYAEAASGLEKLAGMSLTPEQEVGGRS
jgi:hypothetical protein